MSALEHSTYRIQPGTPPYSTASGYPMTATSGTTTETRTGEYDARGAGTTRQDAKEERQLTIVLPVPQVRYNREPRALLRGHGHHLRREPLGEEDRERVL